MLASSSFDPRPLPAAPRDDVSSPPPSPPRKEYDTNDKFDAGPPRLPPIQGADWSAPSTSIPSQSQDGAFLASPRPGEEGLQRSASASASSPADSSSPRDDVRAQDREDKPAKRSNPLIDLIDTEGTYVDLLTGIIRKVASAWSRSNFPPKELDMMFRGIEAVYKANRGFLGKLKEIGPNPSSPKVLGDLLMRWIDDLEAPYTKYCSAYATSFDEWPAVQSNSRLHELLSELSASIPVPKSSSSGASDVGTWTLDTLFLLPRSRLKYYKKLYARLLKSTQPGRSDHRLLLGANEKLDQLLEMVDSRMGVRVGEPKEQEKPDVAVTHPESEQAQQTQRSEGRDSVGSSARGSSLSSGERLSRDTAATSIGRTPSSQTLSAPVSDLERRLSTARTLDIFTMQPKAVKLSMNPPGLPFFRSIRFSADVTISFTPRATGVETLHQLGHIFLLTDLFLICERMTPEERAEFGPDGPDMWLCYPPLAGKHLRTTDVQDNIFQVHVMRKEVLQIHAESRAAKEHMLREFQESLEAASSLPPRPPANVPPVPSLTQSPPFNGLPRSPSAPLPSGPRLGPVPPPHSNSANTSTTTSPVLRGVSPGPGFDPRAMPNQLSEQMSRMGVHDSPHMDPQRGPAIQGPRPSSSASPPLSPLPPGAYVPPPRGASIANGMAPNGMPLRPNPMGPPLSVNPHAPPRPIQDFAPQPSPPLRQPSPGIFPNDPRYGKSPSMRSIASTMSSAFPDDGMIPPLPGMPPAGPPHNFHPGFPGGPGPHSPSSQGFPPRSLSIAPSSRAPSQYVPEEPSPPNSPLEEEYKGPVTTNVTAKMKCKVFLQQQHAQWKSLGAAQLKLFHTQPTNVKQLVVEADTKDKTMLISTIVLTDGVERVGKTGIAIELSDKGVRTGVVYMIQLRNEASTSGLFNALLAGSDRAPRR